MSGCGSDDASNSAFVQKRYKVSFNNLTYKQPMSPPAVVLHSEGYRLYQTTHAVSVSLEKLAEGGDNSDVISDALLDNRVISAKSAEGVVVPSGIKEIEISGMNGVCISIAAMLVNTNDAFVGASCIKINTLASGEKLTHTLFVYDAGTEENSERAITIPGPASGGEGFNAQRNDRNFVSVHAGVVSADDGLIDSVLSYDHRWDNPAASLTIERLN